MSNETQQPHALEYAGVGTDGAIEVIDAKGLLRIVQRMTLRQYIIEYGLMMGILGTWAIVAYFLEFVFRRKRPSLPRLSSVTLSAKNIRVWNANDTAKLGVSAVGHANAPLHCIQEIRPNRAEPGVWIDAPGHIKATYFRGRKDAQAIADLLNRRLQQLRDAEG